MHIIGDNGTERELAQYELERVGVVRGVPDRDALDRAVIA